MAKYSSDSSLYGRTFKHYLELSRKELNELLDTTLPDCSFPTSLCNTLERHGIMVLHDLLNTTSDQLLKIDQISVKRLKLIYDRLRELGFYNK